MSAPQSRHSTVGETVQQLILGVGAVCGGAGAAIVVASLVGWALGGLTAPGRAFASMSWLPVGLVWCAVGSTALGVVHLLRRRPVDEPQPTLFPDCDELVEGDVEPVIDRRPVDRPQLLRFASEAALVVFVILLLVGRWPSAWIDGWIGSVDTKYYGWLAWRLAELDAPSMRLDGIVHPGGLELTLLDGLGPIGLSGLGVRLFGRWLGYNLVVAGGLIGNYLAARHLARTLGGGRAVVISCGLAYLAAPMFVGPVGSFPSLLWACTTPLLLAETIRAARGDGDLRLGRVLALLVGAYLCSIYHLVFGVIAAVLVALLWPGSRLRTRTEATRAAVVVVGALLVLSPFIVARLNYTSEERDAGASASQSLDDAIVFSADALDPLALPPESRIAGDSARLGLGTRPLEVFRTGAIGFALLLGAGLGLVRRSPGRNALSATAATMWLLSLGPVLTVAGTLRGPTPGRGEWLPYRALLAVPGLAALRAPYRVTMTLAAVLVALMAIGLTRLLPRQRRVAFVALAIGGAASWWPQTATSRVEPPAALVEALPAIDLADPTRSAAVLVVPFTCGFDDLDVMNWQPTHERPMVVCGVSQSATRWFTRLQPWFESSGFAAVACHPETTVLGGPSRWPASTRLDGTGLDELRSQFDVRWMVFDRQRANDCPTAADTLTAMSSFPVLADDGRFLIVDIGAST